VTDQLRIDGYSDAGTLAALALVNELTVERPPSAAAARASIEEILAVDPPSVARLRMADVPAFGGLADRLKAIFDDLRLRDVDAAAGRLNALLAEHPAHPHLAKEGGTWRMHHHPAEAELVPMWTSICAEALARIVGAGHADRLGTCRRDGCARVFVDLSRNGSRRFCSVGCQNRVKSAAFRRRRAHERA
jgi:hypothetical protein